MGFFVFLILLVLIGAAIYFYNRLQIIEEEIRREIAAAEARAKAAVQEGSASAPSPQPSPASTTEEEAGEVEGDDPAAEDPVFQAISAQPGLLQTELYLLCPELQKRQVQARVRALVEGNLIRREREKTTYRLFPV